MSSTGCRTFARLAEDPDYHFSVKLEPGDIEVSALTALALL